MTRLQLAVTKSTEQLAKSNGSNTNKENARRAIQTELRVRIWGRADCQSYRNRETSSKAKMNLPNPAQSAFAGVLLQEHCYSGVAQKNGLNAVKEAFDHNVLIYRRYIRNRLLPFTSFADTVKQFESCLCPLSRETLLSMQSFNRSRLRTAGNN
jgi:hypothetical protein